MFPKEAQQHQDNFMTENFSMRHGLIEEALMHSLRVEVQRYF